MEEKKEGKAKEEIVEEDTSIRADRILIATAIIIVLIVFGTLAWIKFMDKPVIIETIDDLHKLNLDGELDPEYGYVYEGYSFVYLDNLWYTQLQTKGGEVMFDVPLHYGPRDLEDVEIYGYFNNTLFSDNKEIYVTFNPVGRDENFKFITVAIGEFNQPMIRAFNKLPVAACDREAEVCEGRPIITCENSSLAVLYVQEAANPQVELRGGCLVVKGTELGIIKAVDRLLMHLYGIM